MSITINDKHWLVADWIMRNLFKDVLYEIKHSYEQHQNLKERIEFSIKAHTYHLQLESETDSQTIADLGYLIEKFKIRTKQERSTSEIAQEGDIVYSQKTDELKSLIDTFFTSNINSQVYNSIRLENEYKKSIWLYLEKVTYYLIYLNKELQNKNNLSELSETESYADNFEIKYKGNQDELFDIKLFHNLISLIPRNENLISSIIYLGKDQNQGTINYCKHNMIEFSTNKSTFQRVFKIRQEWGGSYWRANFASNNENQQFDRIEYEEINKFKMEFKFKIESSA